MSFVKEEMHQILKSIVAQQGGYSKDRYLERIAICLELIATLGISYIAGKEDDDKLLKEWMRYLQSSINKDTWYVFDKADKE